MTYSKSTDFAAKDYLLVGNPSKIIRGTEIDDELTAIESEFTNGVVAKTGNTGSAKIPSGTQGQRDVSPVTGYTRFNTTTGAFEGYNGTEWGSLGSNNGPVVDVETYVATAGQTVFPLVNGFTVGKNQLEVYVDGINQYDGATYAYVETDYQTVTFVSGLHVGALVKFCIWRSDTMVDGDAANISYSPAGGASVVTTVQAKLRESVSVLDYMTPTQIANSQTYALALAAPDVTTAFNAASDASDHVIIPPGYYKLDEFWHKNKKVFIGSGIQNTFILQADTARPAWWCVSTPSKNTGGQNHGCVLKGVWFVGKTGSTVASCIVEALAPYVVAYSEFDFGGSNNFHTLEVKCGSAFEVYSSKFSVYQDQFVDPSGNAIGSYDTGVICGGGVYNEWYLNVAHSQNGIGFTVAGWDNVFHHCTADGQISITGQENTFIGLTVEGWTGAARTNAVEITGFGNRFVNGPHIINVARSKISGAAVGLSGDPAGQSVQIDGLRLLGQGAALTFTAPLSAASSGTLTTPWTSDATGVYMMTVTCPITFTGALVAATSGTLTANWTASSGVYRVSFSSGAYEDCLFTDGSTAVSWVNSVSATASATATIETPALFTNGSTAVSWTIGNTLVPAAEVKLVTGNAAATMSYNIPASPLHIRAGNSGDVTNIDSYCPYRIDNQPNSGQLETPRASDLARFTFSGNVASGVRRGTFFNDSGTATFAAATTKVVTLNKLQPDTSYRVSLAPQANKTFWVNAKTAIGFTLNASSASSDVVDWAVTR